MIRFAKIKTYFVTLATLFIASGCSYFSPEYHKPELDAPEMWQSDGMNQEIADLPYLQWWQNYNDPNLNKMIELALAHNRNVAIAAKNIELAQSELNVIALNWLPGVSFLAGFTHGDTSTSLNGFNLPSGGGSFLAIIPQYTINVFTNYSRYQQAKHGLSATKAEWLSVRLAVISQTVTAYFNVLFEIEQLSLLTKLHNALKQQVTLNQNMIKQGFGSSVVLDQLKALSTQTSGQIKLQQQNVVVAKNGLRYLLGMTPGMIELDDRFNKINIANVVPGNLPVSVLATRPDLIAAEERLKAVNQSTAVASSTLLPSISLSALFARENISSADSLASNVNAQSAYAASMISPSAFGAIAKTKVSYSVAELAYLDAVNLALHDVQNKLSIYQGMYDKYDNNVLALSAVNHSLTKQLALYQQGVASNLTVLSAQIESIAAAMIVDRTKFEMLVANVQLYQSLGGGSLYNVDDMKITNGVIEDV